MTPAPAPAPRSVITKITGVYPVVGTEGFVLTAENGNAYYAPTDRMGNYSIAERPLVRSLILLHPDGTVGSVEAI